MSKWLSLLIPIIFLTSCAERALDILPPSSSVTRQEAVLTSRAYTDLCWTPGKLNSLHGDDPSGIRVDTPDRKKEDNSSFRWVPGERICGMAYKWGGFDTPKEFVVKIQSTYHPALGRNPAGDIATPYKIRMGDDAVSPYAAGIDCSGFVSRCWRLPKPYSTRELPGLCVQLRSFADLEPGDIINKPGEHVIMFVKWGNQAKTVFVGSEAAGGRYWRVVEKSHEISKFAVNGYVPLRYRNIK